MRQPAQPGIVPRYHIQPTAAWHKLVNTTPTTKAAYAVESPRTRRSAGYVTCLISITYGFLTDERMEPRS